MAMDRKWGLEKGDLLPGGCKVTEEYIRKGDWQIWKTQKGSVLCVSPVLHQTWLELGLTEPGVFVPMPGNCLIAEDDDFGLISSSTAGPYPKNLQEVLAIVSALRATRKISKKLCLSQSFFLSRLPCLLPFGHGADPGSDSLTLGRWLTGGMNVPFTDRDRICNWTPGMTDSLFEEILDLFGWEETTSEKVLAMPVEEESAPIVHDRPREKRKEGEFRLAGRPELEKFFRERIIDVIDREEEYRRMGVSFPGPTLLIGPPGCGKTYAVEKLSEYLGWPCFRVNSASIGSSYVHETSRLISELFRKAMDEAPSVVVMDEMEAYLSSREEIRGSYQFHLEEMAEFLRILPQLAENKVLLFGMTNLVDQIDPAIRRKGRFDHVIELDMPSKAEILDLLDSLLAEVPKEPDLHLARIADRLAMHPISDIVYVAREAGRLTIVNRKERMNDQMLVLACDELDRERKKKQTRSIGFH